MSNLKIIISDKERMHADSEDILRDALKSDFESVMVVGIKNNEVHSHSSKINSMSETLGLIEIAKLELIKRW